MRSSSSKLRPSGSKTASVASIVVAFACLYIFWGTTYTAIRVGVTVIPALLLAGVRFVISGAILLAWCRWRGMKIAHPPRALFNEALVALLLLGASNVSLVYAEKTLPSGLAALSYAVIPLYVALVEMFLPGGETLSPRGWLGILLGFAGLAGLLLPSVRTALRGSSAVSWALVALLGGAFSWTVGSIYSRHARRTIPVFVAAGWQMLIAGLFNTALGTALGEWPQAHLNRAAAISMLYLITGGSLIGYSAFVYLLEHVPVAKVTSYTWVNPLIAVLVGAFLLHERLVSTELAGMVAIVAAVILLTTSQIRAKGEPKSVEGLEQLPAD
jgi:drug/metabolite transporter (DMT)-like permease